MCHGDGEGAGTLAAPPAGRTGRYPQVCCDGLPEQKQQQLLRGAHAHKANAGKGGWQRPFQHVRGQVATAVASVGDDDAQEDEPTHSMRNWVSEARQGTGPRSPLCDTFLHPPPPRERRSVPASRAEHRTVPQGA